MRFRSAWDRMLVVGLVLGPIVAAIGLVWLLRESSPSDWWQSLLPEAIGFLFGSVATYVIIDRIVSGRRRRSWRAVESQILSEYVQYSARFLDAVASRYSQASSHETLLYLSRRVSLAKTDGVPPSLDVAGVLEMFKFSVHLQTFASAVEAVLEAHGAMKIPREDNDGSSLSSRSPDERHAYHVAVQRVKQTATSSSDAALTLLRKLAHSAPDTGLIVELTDDPTIARLALEARSAITSMDLNFDKSDPKPFSSDEIKRACDASAAEHPKDEDLDALYRYWMEIVDVLGVVVSTAQLTMALGAHSSRWSRDTEWRRVRDRMKIESMTTADI
jgi:hypothetical protein